MSGASPGLPAKHPEYGYGCKTDGRCRSCRKSMMRLSYCKCDSPNGCEKCIQGVIYWCGDCFAERGKKKLKEAKL